MIITLSRKDRVLRKPAVLLLWEASLLPWGTFTSSIGHGLSPPSSHQPRGHPAGWDNQVPICSLASTLWWEDTHHSTFWPGKVARANASIQILEKTPLSTQNSLRAKLLFWKHFIYLFLAVPHGVQDFSSLTELNLCPLQWEHRVLTTEPPGKTQGYFNMYIGIYKLMKFASSCRYAQWYTSKDLTTGFHGINTLIRADLISQWFNNWLTTFLKI